MRRFSRDEVEQAFRRYWQTGAVGERWSDWADLFTPKAQYIEHVLGNRNGREEIRSWIIPTMAKYGEIYTAYEWHLVDESGRAVVTMQNRRDHPSGGGAIDFPGVTLLQYAGDGLWSLEEDYWAVPQATRAFQAYAEACKRYDPDHARKMTRLDWGKGPAWTLGAPSYAERAAR